MAGDTIAVSQGSQALAGHNPLAANETKRIFADEQGGLRIDGGFKSVNFTWNSDSTASVIDVVKVVNGSTCHQEALVYVGRW